MREILFRGKRIDNDKWVYGNLFIPDMKDTPTQICIGTNVIRATYDIDPSTVGQYTGLTDKNGKKIFEGDILHFKAYRGGDFACPIGTDIYYRVLFGHCNPDSDTLSEYVGFWALDKNYDEDDLYECGESINYLVDSHGAYVIGNIYDNPELLRSDTE